MTALAIALTALSAALLGALITVLAWYRAALVKRDELDHERDLLVRERDGLTVTNSTLTADLEHERGLRALAEAQRDAAERRIREHIVPLLTSAGVTDAIRTIDGLLAGGMPHGEVPAGDPGRTDDDLLAP